MVRGVAISCADMFLLCAKKDSQQKVVCPQACKDVIFLLWCTDLLPSPLKQPQSLRTVHKTAHLSLTTMQTLDQVSVL